MERSVLFSNRVLFIMLLKEKYLNPKFVAGKVIKIILLQRDFFKQVILTKDSKKLLKFNRVF